ncbi:hypothetical protein [Streptomyces sp. CBMA156]|uniref:hypothetical protein n=1 Tax=Streptomyces sp. CBMA156 TaxID=1930280 RepID=UPI001661B8FF|nr:hypothetical protein [Streptomyces sp. CBMA156]MBD0673322.1 hypothetical protein [Streptomyces sp. CBMA156]
MGMRIRSVGVALRFAESVLLAPGQRHARRNAWAAVCENRRYAADRRHDEVVAVSGASGASGVSGPAGTRPSVRP